MIWRNEVFQFVCKKKSDTKNIFKNENNFIAWLLTKLKVNNSFDHPIFMYLKVKKKLSLIISAWCKLIALLQMFRCCEIL